MSDIDWPQIKKDVVVVIFQDEVDLFKLQLRSFNTFLEECNLHIVINEDNIKPVHSSIKRDIIRSKHKIKIWSRKEILGDRDFKKVPGWTTQQLLKLMIPLKRDWIVFDAKDLLIRPVQLIDLDKKQRKDYENIFGDDPQAIFYQGVIKLCKRNKLRKKIDPKNINMNHTPRVIVNGVIREIMKMFKNDDEFIDWFLSFEVQGEFILHDYVALQLDVPQKLRFPVSFNAGIWRQHNFDELTFDSLPPTTHVYKCHRRVYAIKENREKVDKWMYNIMKRYEQYYDALMGKNIT